MSRNYTYDVIIIGGGIAGLSAAIYLGRAERQTLVIDSGKSMAQWEPDVQNFLGFPDGISGKNLLRLGKEQALKFGVKFSSDEVLKAKHFKSHFSVTGRKGSYRSSYILIATGIFHIPPSINGVRECLGHSMFFCKDCDAPRVKGKHIVIYGNNTEAAEYALAMLVYSRSIAIVTNGKKGNWSRKHVRLLTHRKIPIVMTPIKRVIHTGHQIEAIEFTDDSQLQLEALFTTRGDVYFNQLAKMLGAKIIGGEIITNDLQQTTISRLYAAGCVTPANCQMIIAAGQGATAAQVINRAIFEKTILAS